jgi:Cu+-exporting ATPase
VVAGVLPDAKGAHVEALRTPGGCVAMVGDGINDAPALAMADLGIAIGSGTDVANEAAESVLVQSDLERLADVIRLSRRTLRTIRQNLYLGLPLQRGGDSNRGRAAGSVARERRPAQSRRCCTDNGVEQPLRGHE